MSARIHADEREASRVHKATHRARVRARTEARHRLSPEQAMATHAWVGDVCDQCGARRSWPLTAQQCDGVPQKVRHITLDELHTIKAMRARGDSWSAIAVETGYREDSVWHAVRRYDAGKGRLAAAERKSHKPETF